MAHAAYVLALITKKIDYIIMQFEYSNITCIEHVETFFAIVVKRLRATLSGIHNTRDIRLIDSFEKKNKQVNREPSVPIICKQNKVKNNRSFVFFS